MNGEAIKVFIRVRPLNKREEAGGIESKEFKVLPQKSYIRVQKHKYRFDGVFKSDTAQTKIYETVAKQAVESVIDGYNSTVFAYGPTSSGKTFTMFGTQEDPGIIPRSCREIFAKRENVLDLSVSCSFLEIYREKVKDLLTGSTGLRIHQDKYKGTYVEDILEKYVHSAEEVLNTIKEGTIQRSVAPTALNSVSSRSHAVLTINVKQKFKDGSETLSKLHLIDLAGSENVGKSQVQGTSLLEAQTINKSLSCLGNVISALTEKGRDHIPYRDSKLTFLLQDSLGGNSKTVLIATASPSPLSYSETIGTLNFAKRVKEIKNIPKINKYESATSLLKRIEELKTRLTEQENLYSELKANIGETGHVENKVLIRKIERLEKEKAEEEERHKKYSELMTRAREHIASLMKDIQRERVKSYRLSQELESYKSLYENLKGTEAGLLPLMIQRFTVPEINVNTYDFAPEEPPEIE
jgi:hypothetical protein